MLEFSNFLVTFVQHAKQKKGSDCDHTGWKEKNGPPCHTKFDLFSIVLGKSDETMPYRLDLGNSFGVVYIAVTYLVQELC